RLLVRLPGLPEHRHVPGHHAGHGRAAAADLVRRLVAVRRPHRHRPVAQHRPSVRPGADVRVRGHPVGRPLHGARSPGARLTRRTLVGSCSPRLSRCFVVSGPASPGTSVFPRLEPLLGSVQKPIQYVGGELNATVKDWDCGAAAEPAGPTVRWALMYPDAYEVGLPNQGVQILYEVLNEVDWILAERTYAVWPDLEAVMREHGIPQFTVDDHRP